MRALVAGFAFAVLAGPSIIELRAQANQLHWRQWGGPSRNFIVNSTGLADALSVEPQVLLDAREQLAR